MNQRLKTKFFAFCIVLFLLPVAQVSLADSFYSSLGLGMPNYLVSGKSTAMGGAGIGLVGPITINAINPAAIDVAGQTAIGVNYVFESIESKIEDASVRTSQGRAAGFHFVVPIIKGLNLVTALMPELSSRYILTTYLQDRGIEYSRLVRGTGGMSSGNLGLRYTIGSWLSVSGEMKFNFGSYKEEWKTEFSDALFRDASDKVTSHLWGVGYRLGTVLHPTHRLAIGVVFIQNNDLKLETETTLGSGVKSELVESVVKMPSAFGIGLSYSLTKVTAAFDFFQQTWSQYGVRDGRDEGFHDYVRYGGGLEYLDTMSALERYHRRISYRIGYYYAELPFIDSAGNPIDEKFFTFGIGLPFHRNAGRVDLALEVGKRGGAENSLYGETIFRVTGSITTTELWFQRQN